MLTNWSTPNIRLHENPSSFSDLLLHEERQTGIAKLRGAVLQLFIVDDPQLGRTRPELTDSKTSHTGVHRALAVICHDILQVLALNGTVR